MTLTEHAKSVPDMNALRHAPSDRPMLLTALGPHPGIIVELGVAEGCVQAMKARRLHERVLIFRTGVELQGAFRGCIKNLFEDEQCVKALQDGIATVRSCPKSDARGVTAMYNKSSRPARQLAVPLEGDADEPVIAMQNVLEVYTTMLKPQQVDMGIFEVARDTCHMEFPKWVTWW